MYRFRSFALAGLAALALAVPAQAERPMVRLELNHAIAGLEVGGPLEHDGNTVWYVGPVAKPSETYQMALQVPRFNLGLGVAITRFLLIGLRLGLGYEEESSDSERPIMDGDSHRTAELTNWSFGVLPYLEIGRPTGVVRPFGLVTIGYWLARTRCSGDCSEVYGLEDGSTARADLFTVGGGLGLRIHPVEPISLDLTVQGRWSQGRLRADADSSASSNSELGIFTLDAVLGMSVWL